MSTELAEIRGDLEVLRRDCEGLALRIGEILERLAALDFELVGETTASGSAAAKSGVSSASSYSTEEREAAARDTGNFFRRCLSGQPRGDSGRSQVRLQNRVYVVIRTFAGAIHTSPVLVFDNFAQVKRIVAEPGTNQFGDSVFAGFATKWEAKLAVSCAGYSWPQL